jgi:hypothetical protein
MQIRTSYIFPENDLAFLHKGKHALLLGRLALPTSALISNTVLYMRNYGDGKKASALKVCL